MVGTGIDGFGNKKSLRHSTVPPFHLNSVSKLGYFAAVKVHKSFFIESFFHRSSRNGNALSKAAYPKITNLLIVQRSRALNLVGIAASSSTFSFRISCFLTPSWLYNFHIFQYTPSGSKALYRSIRFLVRSVAGWL